MTNDFYDLLGVDRDASQEEIRSAYRRQVRKYHPDLNDDPRAPAQFTALKKAYDTLGDPKERDAYERLGHEEYVQKRISSLPSPDQWEIPEQNGTGEADEGADVAGDRRSAGDRTAATGAGRGTNATGAAANGAGTGTTDATAGSNATGAASAGTASNTAGSGATAAGAGNSATARSPGPASATGSAGTTARREPTGSTADGLDRLAERFELDRWRRRFDRDRWTRRVGRDRVAGWFEEVNLGWPLIILADTLYVLGFVFYAAANEAALGHLLERLSSGGLDGLSATLASRHGISSLPAFVRDDLTAGAAVGGFLVIAGAAALPSVYFFIIRETRANETPWQPSYLYVVAALGPVAGVFLDLFAATDGLYVDVVTFFLLPVGAILGLPFSAFLRPRAKRFARRVRHRLRS